MPWRIVAIWACFLARLGFYAALLPLWEGYDEWAHFSVIRTVALDGRLLAPRDQPVPRDVEASLQLAPVPWELRNLPPPSLTEDAYWSLPAEARQHRRQEFQAMPARWSREMGPGPLTAYEALQPPLYYWMMAPVVRLVSGRPLGEQVVIVRWSSVLLASLVIPLVFRIALPIFHDARLALVCAASAALMPEFAVDVARVANDCLAVLLFTLLILEGQALLSANTVRNAGALGVTLGLGLLTKAYFLAAVPAVLLLLAYEGLSTHNRAIAPARMAADKRRFTRINPLSCFIGVHRRSSAAKFSRGFSGSGWYRLAAASLPLILAALISGWWYLRNLQVTHTLSGLSESVMLRDMSPAAILLRGVHLNWRTAIDGILLSHIYFGGWSSLTVRSWMYHTFYFVIAIAALGLLRTLRLPGLWWLFAVYAAFWAGNLYNVILLYVSKGLETSMGWYLYAVVAAEVVICVAGLTKIHRWAAPAGVVLFGLLDLYTVHAVAIPYYTGIIRHRPGGAIAALHLADIGPVGLAGALERLSAYKGAMVSEPLLAALWLAYLAATLWLAAAPLCDSLWVKPRSGTKNG